MKKLFILSLIAFQLFVILIFNIHQTCDNTFNYYHPGVKEKPAALKVLEKILRSNSDFLWYYGTYTGTVTGYGFYAPSVASQVVYTFYVKDVNGRTVAARSIPEFETQEAVNRFSLCSSIWLEKFNIKESVPRFDKLLKAITRQIAKDIAKNYAANTVDTKVYLYQYPGIDELKKGETEKLILAHQFTFDNLLH